MIKKCRLIKWTARTMKNDKQVVCFIIANFRSENGYLKFIESSNTYYTNYLVDLFKNETKYDILQRHIDTRKA